jgi:hypothetical protein
MPDSTIQANESLITAIRDLRVRAEKIGLEAIRPEILQMAVRVVRSLPVDLQKVPMVVPMSEGRLQLEWHDGPKTLEIEFASADEIHYLKWDSSAGIEEEDILHVDAETPNTIATLITWFSGEQVDG